MVTARVGVATTQAEAFVARLSLAKKHVDRNKVPALYILLPEQGCSPASGGTERNFNELVHVGRANHVQVFSNTSIDGLARMLLEHEGVSTDDAVLKFPDTHGI